MPVVPRHLGAAAGGLQDGRQHPQDGCLTCAVDAEKAKDPPWVGLEGHSVHRLFHALFRVAKMLPKLLNTNHRGIVRGTSPGVATYRGNYARLD